MRCFFLFSLFPSASSEGVRASVVDGEFWAVSGERIGSDVGRLGGRAKGEPDQESLNFRVGPYANTSKGPICDKNAKRWRYKLVCYFYLST